MAKMLTFPASRRVDLIQNAANMMLRRDRPKADAWLAQRLSAHAEILRRKGLSEEVIDADCVSYEAAVRAVMWRQMFGTGGVA